MKFLLTRYGLINVDHVVEIRKSWAGLRIELTTGQSRVIELPDGVNVDRFLEELSLQMIRSQIVDLESLVKQVCGHNSGSAICEHRDPDPADVDTNRFQNADTGSAAESVDTEEDVHRMDTACSPDVDANLIWIEINERVRYALDEERNEIILQHKQNGEFRTLKKFRYEDLKRIWDALPEKATTDDVREVAKAGVRTGNLENYLMRIFTHVKFGGDLRSVKFRDGYNRMVLIKNPDDCFFREEIRRQLKLERELIGKVDSYGGV